MIISASYRTDIPAYYGAWFRVARARGYCEAINPYGRQVYRIALDPESVSGFVFWTKNIGPFMPCLAELHAQDQAFVVQYTINRYPRILETAVPAAAATIAHMKTLCAKYGPRAAVWRYDPIIVTSATESDWHLGNFSALAAALEGTTDEVVVSFAEFYRKTKRNLAARAPALAWRDPSAAEKCDLIHALGAIAARHGMTLTACTQPLLSENGIPAARCIDTDRLSDAAGRVISAPIKGNRPGCACAESRDIGEYDTCAQGCVYCYAVGSHDRAQRRLRAHDCNTLRI